MPVVMIAPGPKLQPGEVAIWERHESHPDGEIYLAEGDAPIEAARTILVSDRVSRGRLVELSDDDEAPRPRRGRRPAPADEPPSSGSEEN